MGQAKLKREALRRDLLAELDSWAFPESEWEAAAVAEILGMPRVTVRRRPDHELAYMRMPPRKCHANARFMQDNDPERKLRHVTGWWLQDGNLVLHSVVEKDGVYVCVTPAPYHPPSFEFVPDAMITWRDEGDHRSAFRDGVRIGPGLRSDPSKTLTELQASKAKLLAGMDPSEAFRLGV